MFKNGLVEVELLEIIQFKYGKQIEKEIEFSLKYIYRNLKYFNEVMLYLLTEIYKFGFS